MQVLDGLQVYSAILQDAGEGRFNLQEPGVHSF